MKQLFVIFVLAFAVVCGNAQVPIKAPTKPTRTAAPAKPKPTKPAAKPVKRTPTVANRPRATAKPEVKTTEEKVTEGDVIDLGLSVKWASHNVGANSPEDYGKYYGWADPSGTITAIYSGAFPKDTSNICGTKYDMAKVNWGGSWRLPTFEECLELMEKCTYKTITLNGVEGSKLTSKKNGNSIFLPYAGNFLGMDVDERGYVGCYWTGTLNKDFDYEAMDIEVYKYKEGLVYYNGEGRERRCSVRPVCP